jgi:hypothetical protein
MSVAAVQPYNVTRGITPSDTVNLIRPDGTPGGCDAVYVGGAGVVALVHDDANGTVQNFTCIAGQTLLVKAKRINSTNTTATVLVALYLV